jgi:cell division protein FtsA
MPHSRVSDEWYRESKQSAVKIDEIARQKQLYIAPCFESQDRREEEEEVETTSKANNEESTGDKIKKHFFDRYVDKIKDFLDNAE